MATMVIRATFPLGTFLGHRGVGRIAEFPDTARLHAALVHAAGKGSTAIEDDGQLRPTPISIRALEWLEAHPPSALAHPTMFRVNATPAMAWRAEGVFDGKGKGERKELKSQSDAVAMAGPLAWAWLEEVPREVSATLDQLCADVSCLGEADSPVVLDMPDPTSWVGTHSHDDTVTSFPAPGGLRARTPIPGRLAELEADYQAANPSKLPTKSSDRHSWTSLPASHTPGSRFVRDLVYRPEAPVSDAQWDRVVTVEIMGDIDVRSSVHWSVALHRAIVSRLDEAPPMLTGKYPAGARQPANRVAIHLISADDGSRLGLAGTAFLVMVPNGIDAAELAALQRALAGLRRVYTREGDVTLGAVSMRDCAGFWPEPSAGQVRLWRPFPALVPEVRRQRRAVRPWTLGDAAALSVGFVFRDQFAPVIDGSDRYQGIVRAVIDHGVRVREVHAIRDSRSDRYAHKAPTGVTIQPYTCLINMAELVGPSTLFALGQSRHLGGGLMYPEDIAVSVAKQRGLIA